MEPIIIELAKLGIQIFLQASKEAKLTAEQAEVLLKEERQKFYERTPDKLNDLTGVSSYN